MVNYIKIGNFDKCNNNIKLTNDKKSYLQSEGLTK